MPDPNQRTPFRSNTSFPITDPLYPRKLYTDLQRMMRYQGTTQKVVIGQGQSSNDGLTQDPPAPGGMFEQRLASAGPGTRVRIPEFADTYRGKAYGIKLL